MSARLSGPEDDLLAAEYAIGLLDPVERLAVERRRANDAVFATLCETWMHRLAELLEGNEVAPDPALWPRIVARVPADRGGDTAVLRRSLRRWKASTLAASIAAMVLGGLALGRHREPPATLVVQPTPAAPMVVILTSSDRGAIVSLSFDPVTRTLAVASQDLHVGKHSAQLWVIPADNKPRSLGLLPDDRRHWRTLPAGAAANMVAGATLAISLEPVGGSPTGQPTGPVILSGKA